jgi:hypothetical protein
MVAVKVINWITRKSRPASTFNYIFLDTYVRLTNFSAFVFNKILQNPILL